MSSIKYLLTSFGPHNFYLESEFPDHAIYPVATEFVDGFDLDYSTLLIGNGYLIDQSVLDYLLTDSPEFLRPMRKTLSFLRTEGLLHVFDGGGLVKQHRERIEDMSNRLVKDIEAWHRIVRDHWLEIVRSRGSFVQKFVPDDRKLINSSHYTVYNATVRIDGKATPDRVRHGENLVLSPEVPSDASDREFLTEIIKPLISHLVIHDLFRHTFDSPLLDWDDSRAYYDHLYFARWDLQDDSTLAEGAKRILNLRIPTLTPYNIEAVVRFTRDNRAVRSLRSALHDATRSGIGVDEHWMNGVLAAALSRNLARERRLKQVRLGSSIAGLLIPGTGLLTDLATKGIQWAMEDAIEKRPIGDDGYWVQRGCRSDSSTVVIRSLPSAGQWRWSGGPSASSSPG